MISISREHPILSPIYIVIRRLEGRVASAQSITQEFQPLGYFPI